MYLDCIGPGDGSLLWGMALLGDMQRHLVALLLLYGMPAMAHGGSVWHLLRQHGRRRSLVLIAAPSVLFRVILLFTAPPTFSTDVYRYIWDGRLVNAGVNPYAHAVDSPLLDPFHSPLRRLINRSWKASPSKSPAVR